jgi:hypothetical protein
MVNFIADLNWNDPVQAARRNMNYFLIINFFKGGAEISWCGSVWRWTYPLSLHGIAVVDVPGHTDGVDSWYGWT